MNHKQQEVAFSDELDTFVGTFVDAHDLTTYQVIGALQEKIHRLLRSYVED